MKFSHLYEELKFDDVFPVASKEELAARKSQYAEIQLKEKLDKLKKTKLPDGTWHIHDTLNVASCNLSSLKPLNISIVDKTFTCTDNKLTSLEGCPKEVKDGFYCSDNTLTSLEGCPTSINGDFWCYHCQLTSLEGGPKEVRGHFICGNNKLTSLEGAPSKVGGDFDCANNAKIFTEAEVREVCDVKGEIII